MDTRFCSELARRLACSDYVRAFEEARLRHQAFQQHPTLLAAIDEIAGLNGEYGNGDSIAIDALFRGLLVEHRDTGHPVFAAALTLALFPAIKRLCRRTVSSVHDSDEIGDIVLGTCLEAITRVARVADRDRLAMRLVQQMERQTFRVVGKACRDRRLVRDLVAVAASAGAMEPFAQGRREETPHAGELLVEIREATRLAHQGDDRQLAKRMNAAASLRDRVRLLYPNLSEEDQEQMYERLKKRGTRAFQRVKSVADLAQREADEE